MSKKIVVAGSLSLEKEIERYVNWLTSQGLAVINYPSSSSEGGKFPENYPEIKRKFYQDLSRADILFVVNEDKSGIGGYIGAQVFAEMVFVIAQNLVYDKNIQIILAKKPSREIQSYEEVEKWLELGWMEISEEKTRGMRV